MSKKTKNNDNVEVVTEEDAGISYQSLRKGELRLLATEFESRTIQLLAKADDVSSEFQREMILSQLDRRFTFLARLQAMDLTVSPNDWADLAIAWSNSR